MLLSKIAQSNSINLICNLVTIENKVQSDYPEENTNIQRKSYLVCCNITLAVVYYQNMERVVIE